MKISQSLKNRPNWPALAVVGLWFAACAGTSLGQKLLYQATEPPLQVAFSVDGGHYSGKVHPGALFLQSDISIPPLVRWAPAEPGALYTLMMLDFDGDAFGSWPDAVAVGENAPIRHWIVGNIPGELLSGSGYQEPSKTEGITVLQEYRGPHIPVVSDRYGLYLFKQAGPVTFAPVEGPIVNYDPYTFLKTYGLGDPVASNYFIAIYTSESPFSGKPFHGNDVQKDWHKNSGTNSLSP